MVHQEIRREIALKEWSLAQQNANIIANHIFMIRGWSITIFSGIIALGINNKDDGIVLLALMPAFLFYLLEIIYSGFVRHWANRSHKIENWLASDMDQDFRSPALEADFVQGSYSTLKSAFKGLRYPSSWLLFAGMVLMNVAIYWYL